MLEVYLFYPSTMELFFSRWSAILSLASHPGRSRNTLTETGISSGLMGHSAGLHTLPLPKVLGLFCRFSLVGGLFFHSEPSFGRIFVQKCWLCRESMLQCNITEVIKKKRNNKHKRFTYIYQRSLEANKYDSSSSLSEFCDP